MKKVFGFALFWFAAGMIVMMLLSDVNCDRNYRYRTGILFVLQIKKELYPNKQIKFFIPCHIESSNEN